MIDRIEGFLAADRERALARLVPPLVHRLNNSLAILSGTTELRLEGGAEVSLKELAHMRASLRHLSLFSRAHEPTHGEFDLAGTVEAVECLLVPFAEALHVDLELQILSESALVVGDPYRLEQLVLTLLCGMIVDAADHADPGDTGDPGENWRRVRFAVRHRGERVLLTLAGPSGDRENPLEPRCVADLAAFGREAHFGAFLRRLGDVTACRLDLPSAVERGNEVEQDLPRVPAGGHSGRAVRLLLVERDDGLRELIVSVLAEAGYAVEAFEGPVEVDELLRRHSELILLDADVEGDRPGLIDELRSREQGSRRLLVLGQTPQRTPPLRGGFLPKPFRPQELLRAVHERMRPEPTP